MSAGFPRTLKNTRVSIPVYNCVWLTPLLREISLSPHAEVHVLVARGVGADTKLTHVPEFG